jgi:hypothetical protein
MRLDYLPSSTLPGRERVLPACHSQTPFPGPQALFSLEGEYYTSGHNIGPRLSLDVPALMIATPLEVLEDDGPDASVAPTGTWLVPARAAADPA